MALPLFIWWKLVSGSQHHWKVTVLASLICWTKQKKLVWGRRNVSYFTVVNTSQHEGERGLLGGVKWWQCQWLWQWKKMTGSWQIRRKPAKAFLYLRGWRRQESGGRWRTALPPIPPSRLGLGTDPDGQTGGGGSGLVSGLRYAWRSGRIPSMDLNRGLLRYGCSPGFIRKNTALPQRDACRPAAVPYVHLILMVNKCSRTLRGREAAGVSRFSDSTL